MPLKPLNTFIVAIMLGFMLLLLFFTGFLKFPSASSSIQPINRPGSSETKSGPDPFTNYIGAFRNGTHRWVALGSRRSTKSWSQFGQMGLLCKSLDLNALRPELKLDYVSVLVKG